MKTIIVLKTCDETEKILARIDKLEELMSAELDRLTTEVSEIKTVADSAITLLDGLADRIRELKDDPARLAALAMELDTKGGELAAAITRNTPAE